MRQVLRSIYVITNKGRVVRFENTTQPGVFHGSIDKIH